MELSDKQMLLELDRLAWHPVSEARAIPNAVLDKQHVPGLKPTDLNIIAQIAKHWWNAESAPFPSIDRIANAIGVTARSRPAAYHEDGEGGAH